MMGLLPPIPTSGKGAGGLGFRKFDINKQSLAIAFPNITPT